ncbi:MAG TPA: hypothetical protein VJT49_11320 [Amycolatopsis sp.]|uniref:hypothetical protein n=1 Tax=Amycolatopsis sp. TaxID=37632 RepID=UPI002B482149|nr:hypothetical protein [Amycolatopsis sp.]HKS45680.1 hypothetical protein [Amycolatopsis sp.]
MTRFQVDRRRATVLACGATALAFDLLGAGQPWRVLAVVVFIVVAPGLAFVPLIRGLDVWTRGVLIVAVGLALGAAVSEALALAHIFSGTLLLLMLAGVSAVGCVFPRGAR